MAAGPDLPIKDEYLKKQHRLQKTGKDSPPLDG
jgi:hypothetical protein